MSAKESKTRSSQSELSLICIHHNLTRNHAMASGLESARSLSACVSVFFWNLVAPANIHDSSLAKHRRIVPRLSLTQTTKNPAHERQANRK